MAFTQEDLRYFISQIFFSTSGSQFVVPRQGNWYNAQLTTVSGMNPDTWIAFQKKDSIPRILPFYQYDEDSNVYSTVYKISECSLQIVGSKAEEWAESIAHWLQRGDVLGILTDMNAQLLGDNLGKIVVSNFIQDGLNSVWAYNVGFGVQWASLIEATNQSLVTDVTISGSVTVG